MKFRQSKGSQRITFQKQVVSTVGGSQPNNDPFAGIDGKPRVNPTLAELQFVTKEIEMTLIEQTFTNLKKSLYIYRLENVSGASIQGQNDRQQKSSEGKKPNQEDATPLKPIDLLSPVMNKLPGAKKPDDLGSNWDGMTANTQGTGFKYKPGQDSLMKNFSFDIIPQDQRFQILFGNQDRAKNLMKEAFYYTEDNQMGKNELIQKNLDKRLRRLQEIDVRLMKLRRGVLIPEIDQDNWDRPDDPELERIIQQTMAGELKDAEDTVTEEIRANEFELLLSGKRELEKKLSKARTLPVVFWTWIVGFSYTVAAVTLLSTEFGLFFQHVRKVKAAHTKFLESNKQLDYLGLLLLDLQLYPLLSDSGSRAQSLTRMNAHVEHCRNLKTTLMQNNLYFGLSEASRSEVLIGQIAGNKYRINELLDQVLGKSILLLAGIQANSVPDSQLSMNNETYYYIIQNSLSVLAPFIESSQTAILDFVEETNQDISWTFWLGGIEFFFALALLVYLLWFLKQTTKDQESSLAVFLEIPDYNLKSYFSQAEYFVLLFIGDDTNHIDDLKTEVNTFRKMEEKGYASNANIYQRKKKSFVLGKFWNGHSLSFLLVLIFFPIIYTIIAMASSVTATNRISTLVQFTDKLLKRPETYQLSMNLLGLSLMYPSIPVKDRNSLEYLLESLKQTYQSEEDFGSVDRILM